MSCFPARSPLPERVDITILGGGVNGVALARECAQAHKSVLLIEREDFASGTTSRSSRIVPGGLHALEQGELGTLREFLRGRDTLLREQPHLVQLVDFALAAGPRFRYSALEIRAALWLYRKLGKIDRSDSDLNLDSLRHELDPSRRWSLYSFQDAQCEFPERVVAEWLREACTAGVIARNHTSLLAIRTTEGRVRGVLLRDAITRKESYVESEWVINATGPWVNLVRNLTGLTGGSSLFRSVRTSHIMLRRWAGAPSVALQTVTANGQPISVSPWNGMIQVGSAQREQVTDPSSAVPSAEQIEFLLHCAATTFPHARLSPADIAFSYAGVRPVADRPRENLQFAGIDPNTCRQVLHNHADEGGLGFLSIFGGTLATASTLARKTAHTMGLETPPNHPRTPLTFGDVTEVESTLHQWATSIHTSTGIPRESTEAIARWHGRHAMCIVQSALHSSLLRMPIVDGYPQLVAQAAEAVAYEHAVTLADILLRRVPMALHQDWNESATAQAAQRIAPALNWTEHHMKEEIEAFEEERSRFLYKPTDLKPSSIAA